MARRLRRLSYIESETWSQSHSANSGMFVFAQSSEGAATKDVNMRCSKCSDPDTTATATAAFRQNLHGPWRKDLWPGRREREKRNVHSEQYGALHQATPRLGPYPCECKPYTKRHRAQGLTHVSASLTPSDTAPRALPMWVQALHQATPRLGPYPGEGKPYTKRHRA